MIQVRWSWAPILLALVAGLGLRIARYGDAAPSLETRGEAAIAALLTGAGWSADQAAPLTSDGAFRVLAFRKPGCARPIAVVLLMTGAETASLALRRLGPDATVIAPPSGGSMPHMAVAPAPLSTATPMADRCAPPPLEAWHALRL